MSTVLSHQQWHCGMINSAVTWSKALSHHVTVLSLMCWRCWRDAAALSIMQQCRHWCDDTVNVMRQHCQSCCHMIDSTVTWSSAKSHAQQLCCAIDNKVIQRTVSSLNWQWLCCNCVSWFPFVLAYKTGLFVHPKKAFGWPVLAHSMNKYFSNCW
jgi:hypothetical protein